MALTPPAEGGLDISLEGLSCIKQGFNRVRSRFDLRARMGGRGGAGVLLCSGVCSASGLLWAWVPPPAPPSSPPSCRTCGRGGVTAQPSRPRHVARGDAISNSVFLTLLSRGCGFCGKASKGAPLAPPLGSHDVMEMGGAAPGPQTPARKWETFSTSCPTSGY